MTASPSGLGGVYIALGANLPSPAGKPRETLEEALRRLPGAGDIRVLARSPWYASAPVPPSGQPWFVNGVVELETALAPVRLLARLHGLEAELGRVRQRLGEARAVDLDLLDHRGLLRAVPPLLPHPRMDRRPFVLLPLRDVAPGWRHPATGRAIEDLIAALPPWGGDVLRLRESPANEAGGLHLRSD